MVVTIAGSYRKHLSRILATKREFEAAGVTVLRPHTDIVESSEGEWVRLQGDPTDEAAAQQAQLRAIEESDILYVVNPGGYVGPSATLQVGWAARGGADIICAEPPFEDDIRALTHTVASPQEALASVDKAA